MQMPMPYKCKGQGAGGGRAPLPIYPRKLVQSVVTTTLTPELIGALYYRLEAHEGVVNIGHRLLRKGNV